MSEEVVWTIGVSLDDMEKNVILTALRYFRGNKTLTANALGISIRTIDNKLSKYKMMAEEAKERRDDESRKTTEYMARARGEMNGATRG